MGLKITNAKGERPVVTLYGIIGDEWGGVTADQFRKELAQIPSKESITLHIHSDGGSFFDGVAIHSQLKQRKGDVHVVVDGLAASAASLVAMAGKTITMAQHSWLMIHESQGIAVGRTSEIRAYADLLDAINGEIATIYAARWKGTPDELTAAISAETWLDAEASVDMGLADMVGQSLSVAACVNPQMKYKHVPKVLLEGGKSPAFVEMEARLAELGV